MMDVVWIKVFLYNKKLLLENLDEHSINNEHQQDEEILKINIPEILQESFWAINQ